jgi:arsenate reductase-like glutaredoxin family protein
VVTLNNNYNKKPLTDDEIKRQIAHIDKTAVEKRLRQMGMKDIADKLSRTSNEEIIKMLQNNPEVIKKVIQIMGGGINGR